jgi:hypothetical protein
MAKVNNRSNVRGTVLLSAFTESHETILEETLTIDDYYENSSPMIDDNEFRKQHNIRFIHGRIYDYDGKLDQEFNNEYGKDGAYLRSRIVHADGTIIEN